MSGFQLCGVHCLRQKGFRTLDKNGLHVGADLSDCGGFHQCTIHNKGLHSESAQEQRTALDKSDQQLPFGIPDNSVDRETAR